MAIQIQGTQVRKSGGGGLGSLLGKIVGGVGGFLVGGPAGAATGAGLGGAVGGAIGGAVKPGEQKDLGVQTKGAKESGIAQTQQGGSSAIDKLNQVLDIGQMAYGAANSFGGAPSAPKMGASGGGAVGNALKRRFDVMTPGGY